MQPALPAIVLGAVPRGRSTGSGGSSRQREAEEGFAIQQRSPAPARALPTACGAVCWSGQRQSLLWARAAMGEAAPGEAQGLGKAV